MALQIYPGSGMLPGMTYNSKWSPKFSNLAVTTQSGAQIVVGLAQYPLHDFELTYNFLRDGVRWGSSNASLEFRTMMAFHLSMGGTLGRFLYRNPDDNQVFQNEIGVGDGTTTTFVLTRTIGANGFTANEPVGQADTSTLRVYLNGSATPVDPALYSIDTSVPVANTITFATAPAVGHAVAVDMAFWYYCMLGQDNNTFEKFAHNIWSLSKVGISSCRPGA